MSENCLKYFMWGYQRHFRSSLQVAAKRLFDLLDSNLKPSVTIVGIRIENLDNRHPICLEPEDCGFRVQDLSEVSVLAEQLMRSSRDAKIFYSHPLAQSNQEAKVKFQSYAEAIERILSSAYFFGEARVYVALPEVVSGYLVFVVLTLDGNAIQRHYSLVNKESDSRFPLDRSLIDATVRIFLGPGSVTCAT